MELALAYERYPSRDPIRRFWHPAMATIARSLSQTVSATGRPPQHAASRMATRAPPVTTHSPIVVANEEHRFIAAEQLQHLGVYPSAILLEPTGRNTAPAIAVAALEATRTGNDPLLLVLPSDHVIRDETAFQTAVQWPPPQPLKGNWSPLASPQTPRKLATATSKPPATTLIRPVERFIEKPDLATAQSYLASGDYFWNSGMFLFRASRYLAELSTFQPAIAEACQRAWSAAKRDTDFIRLDKEAF